MKRLRLSTPHAYCCCVCATKTGRSRATPLFLSSPSVWRGSAVDCLLLCPYPFPTAERRGLHEKSIFKNTPRNAHTPNLHWLLVAAGALFSIVPRHRIPPLAAAVGPRRPCLPSL